MRHLKLLKLMFILSFFSLVGCAGSLTPPPPALGEGNAIPLLKELPPYKLQIGDTIQIRFLLNPELEEDVVIRPDGMISTSVIQSVRAYGMTPDELQVSLMEKYGEYLKDPQLTVVVGSFAPTRIYVLGEVEAPGEFVFIGPNLTLLQVLARAGGVKTSGLTDEILIFRRGSDDKPEVYASDYDEIVSGATPFNDKRLAPFDVVYVPKTAITEVYEVYEQHVRRFLPTSFGLSYSLD